MAATTNVPCNLVTLRQAMPEVIFQDLIAYAAHSLERETDGVELSKDARMRPAHDVCSGGSEKTIQNSSEHSGLGLSLSDRPPGGGPISPSPRPFKLLRCMGGLTVPTFSAVTSRKFSGSTSWMAGRCGSGFVGHGEYAALLAVFLAAT
jgi:hypothetical protein